ncbi:MAG: hypothetical protein ACW99F_17450 [Candidatus Hodarchaeales archaeon]|jgi:hypothetical protein
MRRITFFALIIMFSFIGKSFAIDVPPPPIDIDISNSNFEVIDSTQFRIRQLIASDYPDSYWVDFLWNADQLSFEPTNVGEETSTHGKHRVAIVDKSGKYYSDPVAAMNDIASWCGTPSETNTCLLKILPGIYQISRALIMTEYVDIEGSGEGVTKIIGFNSPIMNCSPNAEMRALTIELSSTEHAEAIICNPTAIGGVDDDDLDARFTNVTLIVSGGSGYNNGFVSIDPGFLNPPRKDLKLTNVTISVSGNGEQNSGIYTELTKVIMENVTITVSGGQSNVGLFVISSAIVKNSTIKAPTAIDSGSSGHLWTRLFITSTLLDGSVKGTGSITCAGVYDENFTFYANTCP